MKNSETSVKITYDIQITPLLEKKKKAFQMKKIAFLYAIILFDFLEKLLE